jgi:leucyl-tRNA synthetase
VFTTRPDTIYGTTFLVLSPEHALVNEITTDDKKEMVKQYQEEASKKSDLECTVDSIWTCCKHINSVISIFNIK